VEIIYVFLIELRHKTHSSKDNMTASLILSKTIFNQIVYPITLIGQSFNLLFIRMHILIKPAVSFHHYLT